jgi:integrase
MRDSSRKPKPKYVRVGVCLYRRGKVYHFKGQINKKEFTRSLQTTDPALAKRRLADFRRDQEQLQIGAGKVTLGALVELYRASLHSRNLRPHTHSIKERILKRIVERWPGPSGKFTPIAQIRPSDADRWLAAVAAGLSASTRNDYLWTLQDIFKLAQRDNLVVKSPAEHLQAAKRKMPIRLTPTFEQFKSIIADVRAHNGAGQSADFLEFLGRAGLGQAEARNLTRADVDFDAGQIRVFRLKTSTGFVVPIYPQLRPLLQRLCKGKKSGDKIFKIADAKKALATACRRLDYPPFTQRSLRRMFITKCIELGIDIKVIAQWQGHADSGVLILRTYSHVRPEHSNRMAQLVT